MADLKEKYSYLDVQAGIDFCGGDEEFFTEMLQAYVEDTDPEKLRGFYESEDWKNYLILVHSFKNTSRTIGATALSEKFKELEFAARAENIDFIRENHQAAEEECRELLKKLNE